MLDLCRTQWVRPRSHNPLRSRSPHCCYESSYTYLPVSKVLRFIRVTTSTLGLRCASRGFPLDIGCETRDNRFLANSTHILKAGFAARSKSSAFHSHCYHNHSCRRACASDWSKMMNLYYYQPVQTSNRTGFRRLRHTDVP